ncbi:MAG: OmpH family outer membrane protein [Salinivirgaceae bacterium]|nr:OmpH family outer membrane protein [Salinivirgaceae bacterium]
MKNISLIINVVLALGLGVLYILHFSSDKDSDGKEASNGMTPSTELKVAYVNIDSILLNYKLSVELNEALVGKQSNMKSRLEKEGREFEKDAQIFQDKVQRGIFLTQQRAEEAQQQLMQRQQELQQLEYEYSNQLAAEQQKMNVQLFDSISNFINDFNKPEKYQVILGHSLGGNMLYGSEQLNITQEVIMGLNERYTNKK